MKYIFSTGSCVAQVKCLCRSHWKTFCTSI